MNNIDSDTSSDTTSEYDTSSNTTGGYGNEQTNLSVR